MVLVFLSQIVIDVMPIRIQFTTHIYLSLIESNVVNPLIKADVIHRVSKTVFNDIVFSFESVALNN